MSDKGAWFFAAAITLAILGDILLNEGKNVMFLIRKLFDLVHTVKFWG